MLSATAPRRAEKVIFSLLSSICRQFLVGLARLAGGSSRESVSTLVETSPATQLTFVSSGTPEALSCARPGTRLPSLRRDRRFEGADGLELPRREPKVLPSCKRAARPFGNPLSRRQGA